MISRLKFSHKIMLVGASILVLVLGAFTLNNYLSMKRQTEQELQHVLSEISLSVSQNIANWLNTKLEIVNSVSETSATLVQASLTDKSKESDVRHIVQIANRAGLFKNTYVGTEQGAFILDDESIVLPDGYDARQRPWYQLGKNSQHPTFTEPYIDVTTNALTISAISPVEINGRLLGISGGDINMNSIADIINGISFMKLGYAFLMTKDGKILVHPNKKYLDKPVSQLLGQSPSLNSELVEYTVNDELSLVSLSHVDGIDNVDWYLGVVLNEEKAMAQVDSFRNTAIVYLLIGIIAVIVLYKLALRFLMQPIADLTEAVKDISNGEGDLTQRIKTRGNDEFTELSHHFNQFLEKMHQSVSHVADTTSELVEIVAEVVDATDETMSVYERQVDSTKSVVSSVNELGGASGEIAENAANASSLATKANETATASQNVLVQNIEATQALSGQLTEASKNIAQLHANTDNIGKILVVIKGISEQTNLLALNAAIESARAGEAGRGFAVVADEVRQLAKRTQESTAEIENMIAGLQEDASAAVDLVERSRESSDQSVATANSAGEQMADVANSMGNIDSINHSVAAATEEQTAVIKVINDEIGNINALNQQGANNLETALSNCERLKRRFARLDTMVHEFKV